MFHCLPQWSYSTEISASSGQFGDSLIGELGKGLAAARGVPNCKTHDVHYTDETKLNIMNYINRARIPNNKPQLGHGYTDKTKLNIMYYIN